MSGAQGKAIGGWSLLFFFDVLVLGTCLVLHLYLELLWAAYVAGLGFALCCTHYLG